MQVKWNNVIALAFVTIAIVILANNGGEIGSFLATMKDVGPGHDPEQQVIGLIACGLVFVFILAFIKILTQKNGRDQQ